MFPQPSLLPGDNSAKSDIWVLRDEVSKKLKQAANVYV